MLCFRFKFIRSSTGYHLFCYYRMSLYGCQVRGNKFIEYFYIAWRNSKRRIFHLHPRTHSMLLPQICQCMDRTGILYTILFLRILFLKDFGSDNDTIRVCDTFIISMISKVWGLIAGIKQLVHVCSLILYFWYAVL